MRTTHLRFIVVISLVNLLTGVAKGQSKPLGPGVILTRMLDRYANVLSYKDVGVLRVFPNRMSTNDSTDILALRTGGEDELRVSFKTYFRHPQLFRFEWRNSSIQASRNARIWSDGDNAHSWLPQPSGTNGFELRDESTAGSAVETALKPSGGAVFIVSDLLMKDLSDYTFGDLVRSLSDLRIVREEYFDGETCYVIQGRASNVPWVFWIGKKSYLLRKSRSFYHIGSFYEAMRRGLSSKLIAEEIHREVRINREIPKRMFTGKPRLRKGDVDLTR